MMGNTASDEDHDRMVLSLIRRAFWHRRFNAHDCVAIQDFYDKYCKDLDTKLDDAHFKEGALQAIVEIVLVIEERGRLDLP
jgi:hypothetical protein